MVGIEDTLTLISLLLIFSVKRPSWGTRDMVMSILARILIRATIGRKSALGGDGTSISLPSIRKRIWTLFCCGLM